MKFFQDANVVIDLANETRYAASIEAWLDKVSPRNCALSAITVEELHFGLLTGPGAGKGYEVRNLKYLINSFRVVDFNADAARAAAPFRLQLKQWPERKGERRPGATDLLLAGHAVSSRRVVVSADQGFSFLSNFTTVNWRLQPT